MFILFWIVWFLNGLANAWALMTVWNIFVTPLGVMALTFVHAFGLGLIGTWFQQFNMARGLISDVPKEQQTAAAVGVCLIKSITALFIVGIALLVGMFMP